MYDLSAIEARLQDDRSQLWELEQEMVRCFYNKLELLERRDSPLLAMWRRELEFTYGDLEQRLSRSARLDPVRLGCRYGMGPEKTVEPSRLFRSIQTFYSILIKLIAYHMVSAAVGGLPEGLPEILSGRAFRRAGLCNFCYEDWFSWVLEDWDGETAGLCLRLRTLLEEENTVPTVEAFQRQFRPDSLKRMYETVIPQELRHALGEYYTPGWLADCVVDNALSAAGRPAPELTFLDPTCGSGSLLCRALSLVRAQSGGTDCLDQVCGLDINALAVLTAKTGCLALMADRLDGRCDVVLPVYHCDVISLPEVQGDALVIDTGCGPVCAVPLEVCERMRHSRTPFRAEELLALLETHPACGAVWRTLTGFDGIGRRAVANLLLNRIFAHFAGRADVIVGNPPWVNWEHLPEAYRRRSQRLWPEYGLFDARGPALSFAKEDISVLITYVVTARLLREGGCLSFVLRQVMFKSARNGALFRRFRIGKGDIPFRVLRVDDLSHTKPFEGAGTPSALVLIRRDEAHRFPVPYCCWRRKPGFFKAARAPDASAESVLAFVERQELAAFPAVPEDPSSLWISAPAELTPVLGALLGSGPYRARTGVFTGGANAVFHLNLLGGGSGGTVLAENVTERARRRADRVQAELEPDLIYPLVRGSDLERWSADSSRYILCPHTRGSQIRPVEAAELERCAPRTWAYLRRFQSQLEGRRGFAGWERTLQERYFYMLLRVGDYTFSPYKVAWRYIATSFTAAVLSSVQDPLLGERLYMPSEKLMYVGLDGRGEAFYLCGLLSASPIRWCVRCYMNPTSISAHVLDKLNIPRYDPDNPLHREIRDLCEAGHLTRDRAEREELQCRLDRAAGALYGISEELVRSTRVLAGTERPPAGREER